MISAAITMSADYLIKNIIEMDERLNDPILEQLIKYLPQQGLVTRLGEFRNNVEGLKTQNLEINFKRMINELSSYLNAHYYNYKHLLRNMIKTTTLFIFFF